MFSQIKIGFLRGVGFSIAFFLGWAIIYVILFGVIDSWTSDFEEGDYVEFSEETKLVPSILSYEVYEDKTTLLGVIKNETDYSWERTSLEIEFYLGDTFVRECVEEIQSKIESNTKEHFELSCKSCGDTFPEFERAEIKINDSWIQY